MADSSDRIIEQLVHQFDRPLDFYRELIQNAIDAGSNRVDVSLDYDVRAGRAAIRVEDDGEGMDGRTLEDHFLVLFRSTKEGDFTKIGKFGVGIVSLFAFEPDLVRIHTGRRGESWRLDFKSWRRYDRYRADELREGTLVELFKAMPPAEYAALAQDSRAAVSYWCRHADVRIAFADRGGQGAAALEGAGRSPLAGEGAASELLTEPFSLPHPESLRYGEEGTEAVLGFSPDEAPFFGFYNRGLTLKEGREALLPGIEFKVKSRYFEHTLTRDNVLADDNYRKALGILRRLAEEEMPAKARAETTALAAKISAGDHSLKTEWARRLPYLRWLFSRPPSRLREPDWPIFPSLAGAPLSWARVRAAVSARGGLLLHDDRDTPISRALAAAKVPVLVSGPWIPELRRWLGPLCRIARLDDREYRIAVKQAEADLATAQAERADARRPPGSAGGPARPGRGLGRALPRHPRRRFRLPRLQRPRPDIRHP